MAGRPKKYNIDKTRVATIKLTGLASVLLGEVRKQRSTFDFSRYVSMHLINDFHELNKEELLIQELNLVQLEQDMMNEKFNAMKRSKAIQLSNIREKKQEK